MATASRRQRTPLISQLAEEPYRFDFFQAVRLLDRFAEETARSGDQEPRPSIGHDGPANSEITRFSVYQSHSFPPGAVHQLTLKDTDESTSPLTEMTVSFMGLTGPAGVLPHHLTSLIIDRNRQRDHSLQDYLDLFNHRMISLFYRAWEKYRFPLVYERAHSGTSPDATDAFTGALFSLLGMGASRIRGRLDVDDEALLYYGGHFAHSPRNVVSLEDLLQDYFELPVRIEQFHGQWLYLDRSAQSRMPDAGHPDGLNCSLGTDLIVGDRVWSVENMFRVQLGPLPRSAFDQFMPGSEALVRLAQLVRTYAGPEFDFDVQLILQREDVPRIQLGGDSRLGWNTWMTTEPPKHDAGDAVFRHEGGPSHHHATTL
jgi:type VI secretion system protein ImpH